MSESNAERWNRRYHQAPDPHLATPAAVLADNRHLLPECGRALDLACGRGGNALLLARHALETHAWDYAAAAIEQLRSRARTLKLGIHTEVRDVVKRPPDPDSFDVIVVSRFLERGLAPALIHALRRNGLLFYQTYTQETVSDEGPSNPDYRLAPNELLVLFAPLRVVFYREEGRLGDHTAGFRNCAQLIGMKTP